VAAVESPSVSPGERLAGVRQRIARAAEESGRDPAAITLVAVSKTFERADILPLIAAGQRDFGENRVQEAQAKWPRLRLDNADLRLHLVGPLQTNKVRDAVALFDVIHSLDRDALAAALARELARQSRAVQLLVQVNTGEEPQKAGVAPQEAAGFVERCRERHGLGIDGLMCIPPLDADPAPHFDMLRRLGESLELACLSMGMSADFVTAIRHGATHVRIGTALFGERLPPR
jgi:pyridoxal phosphate enzyme (YggS family)